MKIRLDRELEKEVKEIVEQVKRTGVHTGSQIDILWAEPGIMWSFKCSMSGYWKAIKIAGHWSLTKQ